MADYSEVAKGRMDKNGCPECGAPVSAHDGWGGPSGCTLTDNGVAQRIHDHQKAQQCPSTSTSDLACTRPIGHGFPHQNGETYWAGDA